ncbi:MAG: PAS domain-containing protein, partial [Burkholderiaceae bacterium]|nr:PAS domain-containing protein [Burkholderiaceae bacterium]
MTDLFHGAGGGAPAASGGREYALSESETILSKTDLNGNFTYVNRDCLRISGYAEEELLGQHQRIMGHPDMPKEVGADLWQTLKSGKSWSGIMKNRTKDGGFYWVEANAAPFYENGKMVSYITIRIKPTVEQIRAAEAAYRLMKTGQGKIDMRGGKAVTRSLAARLNLWRRLSVKARFLLSFGLLGALAGANAALAWPDA